MAQGALHDVLSVIEQSVSDDLLALDIRTALHHLGEITGEITTEDLLETSSQNSVLGNKLDFPLLTNFMAGHETHHCLLVIYRLIILKPSSLFAYALILKE